MNDLKRAWYSESAASLWGTVVWLSVDGESEVELTCVGPVDDFDHFKWHDKEDRGVVAHFIRSGRIGTLNHYKTIYNRFTKFK